MNDSDLSKLLGERIRKLREERKFSQQALANECGFERSNMARIEMGHTNPSLRTLKKISAALQVSISFLVDVN